jgi:hypothetical protein
VPISDTIFSVLVLNQFGCQRQKIKGKKITEPCYKALYFAGIVVYYWYLQTKDWLF